MGSCHPWPPSLPSSTSSASACAPWSRAGPKKSEGDRGHLPELDGGPSASGRFGRHPPPVLRRQSPRPHRAVLARRQEPPWYQRRRPRLQAVGEVNPLRHLPTRSEGVELLFHLLEGDERLHRGPAGPMVARQSRALPPNPQVTPRPGQRAGESQPSQPVHLSAGPLGPSDATDGGTGLLSALP